MEDKCQNCEKLKELQVRVTQLEVLIKELQARLASNSSNSRRPPPSDPPADTTHTQGPAGRQGRKGPPGHWRQVFSPERVTEFLVSRPPTCRHCGYDLPGTGMCGSHTRQQIKLPSITPIIREIHCLPLECPRCHVKTTVRPPAEFGPSPLGPRLTLIDRGMGAECLGQRGQMEIKRSLGLWQRYKQRLITRNEFEFSRRVIRARFNRLLENGTRLGDPKAVALCKIIRRNLKSVWTFVAHPDVVEPTNNQAERAL